MKTELDHALVAASVILRHQNMGLSFDLLTCSRPTQIIEVTNRYLLKDDLSQEARQVLEYLNTLAKDEIKRFEANNGLL